MKIEISLTILMFLILTVSVIQAGSNHTPEQVMSVAKEGSIESADVFIVVNEANSFLNRLSSDRSYATKFLEAVVKNDAGAAAAIVKQTAPRCQITISQLKSNFFAVVSFKIKTRNATVCVSGDNSCSGHAASVDVK